METEKYNESRRWEKAAEQLHEIKLQNGLTKGILGFFLLLLSISFAAFLAGDTGLASGILFIVVLKFPIIGGFCIYKIIRNKLKKRKLDFHISDDSLTAIYDWEHVKCRQCGGTDLAEIKSDVGGLEEQIRKREVVLHSPHHGNAALQCNGCGNWWHDRNKLDSDLQKNLDGEYMIGHCPNCGSTDHENLTGGGGCCQPPTPFPNKRCNDCGRQWYSSIRC